MNNSMLKPKRAFRTAVLLFTVLSFTQFLIYYICVGFLYESVPALITGPYLIDFLEAFFPIASSLIVFLTKGTGIKNKIVPSFLISLPRLAYTIPYYYIYYVSDVFDSIEAISLAFLVSILYLMFSFLLTFICICILNFTEARATGVEKKRDCAKLFDLDNHINFGILLCIVLMFVLSLAREGVDTVSYFIEVGNRYSGEEILTIVFSYVILPIFAFAYYSVCVPIKNMLVKKLDFADR